MRPAALAQRLLHVYLPLLGVALLRCSDSNPQQPPILNPPLRVPNTTCRLTQAPELDTERYTNLSFATGDGERGPVGLMGTPSDPDRIFVVEQRGIIHVFRRSQPDTSSVFLDLTASVTAVGNEQGLLGLAFDPNYAQNGYFYVNYTDKAGDTKICRFTRQTADSANPASELLLLGVEQPYENHNGGQLAFGRDGMLYIGLGDGGSGNDPENRAQNKSTLLGKILRIDVGHTQSGLTYAIPSDNPFVGEAGSRGEIWAYGLRNPWRFSFDPEGNLWAGDVGQNRTEEIDIITKGGNYGWRVMEGPYCRGQVAGDTANCTPIGILPVASYAQSVGGCSVTAGFVYRGQRIPELQGAFLYGDYCSGRIWAVYKSGAGATAPQLVASTGLQLTSFGEDGEGELYLVSRPGPIYRLTKASGPPAMVPTRVSATGCYRDVAKRIPANGLVPYEVNAPLWSDGTVKRRFIALQGTAQIDYRPSGAWDFPEGTILMKEFYLEREPGNAASRVALETRLLLRRNAAWEGFTYQWNDEQTDAILLDDSATKNYSVPGSPAGYTHYFPSRTDCLRCHTSAAGGTLGLQTGQLNRNHVYEESTGNRTVNQIAEMTRLGLFSSGNVPGAPDTLERLPSPTDTAVSLELRSRAYLHGNCAHCHLPGGPTPTNLDLRFSTPLAMTNACGRAPLQGDLGVAGSAIIKPGMPTASVLYLRMHTRGANQMPPLASSVVDETASMLVSSWITGLSACP